MIDLGLHRGGSFELDVDGRLHLFKELLDTVEASQDRFDEGLEDRLEGGCQRLDGYRGRVGRALGRHGVA